MPRKSLIALVVLALCLTLPLQAGAESMKHLLHRFEAYADKAMTSWNVPGMAIAVVQNGTTIYAKGFGTARAGEKAPVTPDTVFQAGSVTKAFTVALVAQLVDQGAVGWDDRVVDRFPGFMMFDPWVTREMRIHDLFAQRSGMQSYAGDLQAFMGFDRDHILHSMRFITPVNSFRDRFSYVNNLFVAGARVAEIHAGSSWDELMVDRILTPLGMKNSSVSLDGYSQATDKATMYIAMADGSLLPLKPGMTVFDWPYIYGPAGGLNTTANDMAHWVTAHLQNGEYEGTRIFSKESATYMHTPFTPASKGDMVGAYCQGWLRQHLEKTEIIWHNGNTSGAKSFVGFSPELKTGIVILTNLGGTALPDALGMQFFDMLSGAKDSDWNAKFLPGKEGEDDTGKEQPAPPQLPGLSPADYAGTYANPVYGTMVVKANGAGLVITLGADQQFMIAARHATSHTFAGAWTEISPQDPIFEFVFTVDETGRATGVTMPELDDGSGIETFVRQ